tara:strand:- start:52 stop:342 length:291 start_codon:yes stop_codon:yes gene_type:complete
MKKVSSSVLGILATGVALAQSNNNTLNFNDVTTQVSQASNNLKTIAGYLIWAVLAFAILYAAYQVLVEGGQKTKQAITALLVGLMVVALGFALNIL